MHSTKFLAAILAVAGTGLAMPLEAPIATPASPSAAPAVEGLKESWVGCDNGHCPPEDPSPKERWAAKKAKMPKKTSKPKDLSPEEFEKKVDEFWAEKIKKFEERLAAKKANKPESPPKPADSPCNKDKRDAAVDAACATDDDGFRKLSPEAISAILNAAPGPVVAKSMPAAADKILPNDAIEKIRGRPGPGVVAPTAAVSGPFKLTKRPARTSSATGKPTASSATVSSTAATATNTTGTATGTTAPTKAHLAARAYPSNLADLVRVGPQIDKKSATAIPANMTSQEYCAPRIEKIRQKGIEAGDKVGEPSMATKRAELKAMVGCIIEILTDAWIGPENAKPTATPAPNAPDCAYIMEEGVKEIMAKGDAAVENNEAFQQCVFAEVASQSSALSKRGRITHIPVLDDATRERLIREGEIIVLTGKRKPGTKPKHHQS
ncbi:hypothetical protein K4K48_011236 [Colletotrichum sp. SAR 10_66]|nr:hypothetical protein K4K48_011236 [Colletotrichum sp. SAR 10_66]